MQLLLATLEKKEKTKNKKTKTKKTKQNKKNKSKKQLAIMLTFVSKFVVSSSVIFSFLGISYNIIN